MAAVKVKAFRFSDEELALLEARNAGKPIGSARGEMGMVVDTIRYYSGAFGGAYEPTSETAADSITTQAIRSVDFAALVAQAEFGNEIHFGNQLVIFDGGCRISPS